MSIPLESLHALQSLVAILAQDTPETSNSSPSFLGCMEVQVQAIDLNFVDQPLEAFSLELLLFIFALSCFSCGACLCYCCSLCTGNPCPCPTPPSKDFVVLSNGVKVSIPSHASSSNQRAHERLGGVRRR